MGCHDLGPTCDVRSALGLQRKITSGQVHGPSSNGRVFRSKQPFLRPHFVTLTY